MRKHIRILILAAAIAAGVVAFTSSSDTLPDPQECPCEPGNPCYPKCRETSNQ